VSTAKVMLVVGGLSVCGILSVCTGATSRLSVARLAKRPFPAFSSKSLQLQPKES
jgi:hypothetical protein